MDVSKGKDTRLFGLVRDALIVWPQDAQKQLLEHLRNAGASKRDLSSSLGVIPFGTGNDLYRFV